MPTDIKAKKFKLRVGKVAQLENAGENLTGLDVARDGLYPADQVSFDNTGTTLTATDVQGAIVEAVARAASENLPDSEVPVAPTTDGTYVLKCTVVDGVATLSWVAESA